MCFSKFCKLNECILSTITILGVRYKCINSKIKPMIVHLLLNSEKKIIPRYFHAKPLNSDKLNDHKKFFCFHSTCLPNTKMEIESSFTVLKEFINEEEENTLIKEVDPHLKRLKYEFDHWDDAIHGYREIERTKWSSKCSAILKNLKETSFKDSAELIPQVHVLDLSPEGVIKPHVDSVRFCGNIISGLCLLSDGVMRLIKEDQKDQIIDVFLPRRGLYIMKDASRYKYTHEVLSKESSYFGDKYVERSRRVSVICRVPPL